MAGEEPDGPGRDVDLIDVAKCLFQEHHALAVVGEVSALAEEREAGDVRWQLLVGRRGGAPDPGPEVAPKTRNAAAIAVMRASIVGSGWSVGSREIVAQCDDPAPAAAAARI